MCLFIEVEVPAVPRQEAGAFARDVAQLPPLLELRVQRQPKEVTGSRFLLSRRGDGCACSLLGDNADWDHPFYDLSLDHTEALAATLEFVAARSKPQGFSVRAAWVSDSFEKHVASRTQNISASLLLAEIRSGRIGNNVCYRVTADS